MAQIRNGARHPYMRAQFSARHVTQRRAHGNREIEDGEDLVAVALGVEIGDHRRRKDAEGRLAHAHHGLTQVKRPVAVHPVSGQRGQAPQHRPADNERLAADSGRPAIR